VRITFDSDVDGLTLALNGDAVARTIDAGEGRFVDLNEDGKVVAVEIIGASQGFQLNDLAEQFDLEPLFEELSRRIPEARAALRGDPRLREVLSAH
jgi:uncharacterized protein YuzE